MNILKAIILSTLLLLPNANLRAQMPGASEIYEEVIAQVEDKRSYDWREFTIEPEFAYIYVDEENNFETSGFQIGSSIAISQSGQLFAGVRRYRVDSTPSSRLLGKTPFTQAAGVSRYVIAAQYKYSVLEGQSIHKLSPTFESFDHALFLIAGGNYSHPSEDDIPSKEAVIKQQPGKRSIHSILNLELGAQLRVYALQNIGLFFEMRREFPLRGGDEDLPHWSAFSWGTSWTF